MMYVGEMPWHGLGTALPQNATWEKAREVVGFYEVEKRPLLVNFGDAASSVEVDDKCALVKVGTGEYMATVGKNYGVVQFGDLAEAVVTACGKDAVFHTAGLLGEKGIRGWLLGELGAPIRVKGDESEIRKFFLASSAHDGGTSAILMNAATRVVCANTLGVALGEKDGARWAIRHTSNAADRVREAGRAFAKIREGYERFEVVANFLVNHRLTDKQLAATVDLVLPLPKKDDGSEAEPSKQLFEKREMVTALFDTARGINGIRGTAWGAFQAWTQFADHHLTVRKGAADRLDSIWFGQAAEMKKKALNAIVAQIAA